MSEIDSEFANAMLQNMMEGEEVKAPSRSPEIEAQKLQDLYDDLNVRHKFKPGDLVTWKRGLQNGTYPFKGYPGIVSKVYETPINREDMESGSNHFREPLDMVILIDTGDEVSEFHVDGRRFRPFEPTES